MGEGGGWQGIRGFAFGLFYVVMNVMAGQMVDVVTIFHSGVEKNNSGILHSQALGNGIFYTNSHHLWKGRSQLIVSCMFGRYPDDDGGLLIMKTSFFMLEHIKM